MAAAAEDDAELSGAAAWRREEQQQQQHLLPPREEEEEEEEEEVEGGEDLSLEAILALHGQPINEEQAWAVCYQCCRTLADGPPLPGGGMRSSTRRRRTSFSSSSSSCSPPAATATAAAAGIRRRKIQGLEDVIVQRDGLVRFREDADSEVKSSPCRSTEVVESLGIMVYNALDYGLKETEERELSPPLEQLINLMINMAEAEKDACSDEGYEATEEDEEAEDDPGCVAGARCYADLLKICTSHLPGQSDAPSHYQAVCRALYTETKELRTFLDKIRSAKENQSQDILEERQTRRYAAGSEETETHEYSPFMGRRASSTLSLLNAGSDSSCVDPTGSQSAPPRKRLLKAPSLAELDSSDSDDDITSRISASSSSMATSALDDTSPETLGKKTPPMFLPISSTPQPERRQQPSQQRRHSIEKETPTNVRLFQPPTKKNSKSLEEFCFPVECLSLTVEEVMHIRQVLVKAELEKFQQYKDVYNAMKKGKLCFCCRTKRFSFFTWSYTCQFCKRPVCSQCCKKMRLPSKPYSSLPIYSIGSTNTLPRDRLEAAASVDKATSVDRAGPSMTPPLSKHGSPKPRDDLELPPELTEDWATMEVCVDCKKFISDIISSSKHSLSLATKRARLKRKTQSFYLSSPKGREDYRPSERTINEI
ncbi:unnamed protein product [Merluccius merluccius]